MLAATTLLAAAATQNVAFWAIALVMIAAAFQVVTSTNVVRAALALVIVLAGVAAQYILLAAEFTAVVQVLVYIGAVVVLFLFGIMLTRARIGHESDLDNTSRLPAFVVAISLFPMLAAPLPDAFGPPHLPGTGPPPPPAHWPPLLRQLFQVLDLPSRKHHQGSRQPRLRLEFAHRWKVGSGGDAPGGARKQQGNPPKSAEVKNLCHRGCSQNRGC